MVLVNCWTCGAQFEPDQEIIYFHKKDLYKALTEKRNKGEEKSKERRIFYIEAKKAQNCPSNCRKVINYALEAKQRRSGINLKQKKEESKELKTFLQENLQRIDGKLDNHEDRLREVENEQKKEERRNLRRLRFSCLNKKKWDREISKQEREKIKDASSVAELQIIIKQIQKNHLKIKEAIDTNIFGSTAKHKIGWSIFFILVLTSIHWIRKYSKKLRKKQSKNLKEEIRDKFNLWRLNMGLSVLFYAVSFYLLQQFINKFVRPNIKWCLENWENTTILFVTGTLGILFLIDSYISSELKTPLQRLAIKIESADISEKEKKVLLSKTQWSNENFKETLKRFGLLTIAGTLIKLLEEAFNEKFIANFCYFIPIAFGGWQIYEIGKKIKKSRIN